jgi:hypothetical protein
MLQFRGTLISTLLFVLFVGLAVNSYTNHVVDAVKHEAQMKSDAVEAQNLRYIKGLTSKASQAESTLRQLLAQEVLVRNHQHAILTETLKELNDLKFINGLEEAFTDSVHLTLREISSSKDIALVKAVKRAGNLQNELTRSEEKFAFETDVLRLDLMKAKHTIASLNKGVSNLLRREIELAGELKSCTIPMLTLK